MYRLSQVVLKPTEQVVLNKSKYFSVSKLYERIECDGFYYIISLVIGLLVSAPFSIIFRGKGKVDKGFKVNYYQLSYRRKMIRTLLGLPILILAFFVFYFYIELRMSTDIFFGVFLFLLFSVQLIYNFYMWKKYEKQS